MLYHNLTWWSSELLSINNAFWGGKKKRLFQLKVILQYESDLVNLDWSKKKKKKFLKLQIFSSKSF